VFNLALAHLRCGVELDPAYNIQLNSHEVEMREQVGRIEALWQGRPARVLHFNGLGRHKYPEWRGHYARVADPVSGQVDGDAYAAFLASLRRWLGRYGRSALAWSFYGRQDGLSAEVRDASAYPLFGLLHYLIRSNGCKRVLETGTARGISAACLASAVAHHPGGRVVTFDTTVYAEREALWTSLPRAMAACIEPRQTDSVTGMAAALQAGERYEAVLLDSLHTAQHVLAEFALARQLVCPAGLILVHDATFPGGTVAEALSQIESEGHPIVRLWGASSGVRQDDGLGLAVIENRRRSGGRG
jgi:predicted O-methyltransferase YrrM